MKKIFDGEVYEVLPLKGGIIFSYCKESNEENVLVAYRMLSFDNGRFSNVENDIYLITKFGNNYKSIAALCENHIKTKSITLQSGKVFLMQPDGTAQLVDNDATPIWTGKLSYKNQIPSDIAIHNNSLWAVYPDCNVLLSYNLATMREELRIGGGENSPLKKPRSISVNGDCITVCNIESQNIVEVNLTNYKVREVQNFDEPVYQYLDVSDNRFALLSSGLYYMNI